MPIAASATPSLSVVDTAGTVGQTINVAIEFADPDPSGLTTLTFDVTWDSAVLDWQTWEIGSAATASGKIIQGDLVAEGHFTFALFSFENDTPLADGNVVTIEFFILGGAASTEVAILDAIGAKPNPQPVGPPAIPVLVDTVAGIVTIEDAPVEGEIPVEGSLPEGGYPAEGEVPLEGEVLAEGDMPVEGDMPAEGEIPVEGAVPEGEVPAEGDMPLEGEAPVEGAPAEGNSPEGQTAEGDPAEGDGPNQDGEDVSNDKEGQTPVSQNGATITFGCSNL
jgi:hypothetical protein